MPYTALDGRVFETKKEFKRYQFATFFHFTGTQDDHESLVRLPGEIGDNNGFVIDNLTNCTVLLLDSCDEVKIDKLVNCKCFIGPSCGSVMITNCTGCTMTIACKQLRCKDVRDCDFSLFSLTEPGIECEFVEIESGPGLRFRSFVRSLVRSCPPPFFFTAALRLFFSPLTILFFSSTQTNVAVLFFLSFSLLPTCTALHTA